VAATEREIERLIVRLVGDSKQYERMLDRAKSLANSAARAIEGAGKRMEMVGKRLIAVGAGFRSAGRSLMLRVTAPLVIMGGLATRSFARFDQAMTESTSIMRVTESQIERMRNAALGLSAGGRILQGPKELAEAYFFLASAGKSAEQSMALLPKVSAFATAGAFDMAEATDLLTDAQSALGLSTKDVAQDAKNLVRVSDVLVKANTLANASVRQFSIALTRQAGAALKSYNKDVEEGVAVLAAMADQGIKAELAGTTLSRIMLLLSKAATENTKALEKYNVEVFNQQGMMRNLGDIVANLETSFRGMSDKQRAAALGAMGFEARIQGAILPLLGTSEAIKRYEMELRKAGGTTETVAKKQMRSFTNELKVLWNQVTVAAIEIGEMLAPVIRRLSGYLKEGIRLWRGLSPEVKRAAIAVAALAAAIGPTLIVLGSLTAVTGLAISGLGTMVGVVASLVSPTVIATAAVAGLGAAVLHYTGIGSRALAWFGARWQQLADYIAPAMEGIKNAMRAGDLQLAVKIGWAQIKLVWADGVFELHKTWIGFTAAVTRTWIELAGSLLRIGVKISTGLASVTLQGQKRLQEALGADTTQISMELAALDILAKAGELKTREIEKSMLAEVGVQAGRQILAIKTSVGQLRNELGALNREAAGKSLWKSIETGARVVGDQATIAGDKLKDMLSSTLEWFIPEIPKTLQKVPEVVVPVRFSEVRAIGVGTAEAASLIAEHRAGLAPRVMTPVATGGPAGKGMFSDMVVPLLARVAEAVETLRDKPTIPIEEADLEG